MKIDRSRCLNLLDSLARCPLDPELPKLTASLKDVFDHQWILIDCLGLPLLGPFERALGLWLPQWNCSQHHFCRVSSRTDTAHFFDEVVESDLVRNLIKVDVVDQLVHRRIRSFEELTLIAMTELSIAFKKMHSALDQTKPIAIFSDHGFRLNKSGTRFTHGGSSTLERTVPLLVLNPVGK